MMLLLPGARMTEIYLKLTRNLWLINFGLGRTQKTNLQQVVYNKRVILAQLNGVPSWPIAKAGYFLFMKCIISENPTTFSKFDPQSSDTAPDGMS